MHKHTISNPSCLHTNINFCQQCNVAYCENCDKEWNNGISILSQFSPNIFSPDTRYDPTTNGSTMPVRITVTEARY